MKLKWETEQEKLDRISQYHEWFAWHPVNVGKSDYRWLEIVMRKWAWDGGVKGQSCWHYLPKFKSSYENPDKQPAIYFI